MTRRLAITHQQWAGRALAAIVLGVAAAGAAAQEPAAKATPEEWQIALTVVKQIALDADETVPHRANAVMAYAKLLCFRSQPNEAIQASWEFFKSAAAPELAEAAVRAGCFAARQTSGHLGGPVALINQWTQQAPGGPGRGALAKVNTDLAKVQKYLTDLAGRKMPPEPIRLEMPNWAVIRPNAGVGAVNVPSPKIDVPNWMVVQKDKGPSALQVSLPAIPDSPLLARDKSGLPRALQQVTFPVYTPPDWYGRVQFPLLKEPGK